MGNVYDHRAKENLLYIKVNKKLGRFLARSARSVWSDDDQSKAYFNYFFISMWVFRV